MPWVDPATQRSEFDRLKDSAPAAMLGKFKDRSAYLDALGPTEEWLEGIPLGTIAHFGPGLPKPRSGVRWSITAGHRLAIPGSRGVNAYPWCPRSNAVTSTNMTLGTSPQLQENWAVSGELGRT